MEAPYGYEEWDRAARRAPDQASRLDHDPHRLGRPRRARPWIAVAIGGVVVLAFVALMITGGGDNSESPPGVVVEGPGG